ncbi:MAG TPA: XRE family transcriptional regulator [Clostridia bacterium]|nr:XRE family transcriptional regulator [Clostridia bacterium]
MNVIKDLRRRRGLTQVELGKVCNVHQTAVSQWEMGRTLPDSDSLSILADFFNISIEQILGKGKSEKRRHFIPILGKVVAGVPLEAIEEHDGYEEISPELAANGEHFALRIEGDSMLPRFCPSDIVIVRKQPDVDSGDIAVILLNGNEATVKKIIKKDTSLMLVPLNNSIYEPKIFTDEEIKTLPVTILGKVVELRAKFF